MVFKLLSILVIVGSFVGGFMMAGGNMMSLWHPAELIVILGIGTGVFMASTPFHIWMKSLAYLGAYFKGGRVSSDLYAETLQLLDDLARMERAEGLLALEPHVVDPESSELFNRYPLVLKHEELRNFIADNFSYLLLNPPQSLNFGHHLEEQIATVIQSNMEVPKAVGKVGNLLPGFGIIAAVMGVILTMGLLGGDMDVGKIGYSVGAALTGTLVGIFFAFAVVSPFSHAIEVMIRQDRSLYEMTAAFIVAFSHGVSPTMAYEIGRQRIPPEFAIPRDNKT